MDFSSPACADCNRRYRIVNGPRDYNAGPVAQVTALQTATMASSAPLSVHDEIVPVTQAQLARLAAAGMADGLGRRLSRLVPGISTLRATALGRPIPPLIRGRPERAGDIYRGVFSFGGHVEKSAGSAVFAETAAPADWLRQLHGFDWLKDLAAAGRELNRVNARALIADWITLTAHHPSLARRNDVTARRLIAWTGHAPFYLRGASSEFETALMRNLTRQVRQLARGLRAEPDARIRLLAAIAITRASIGLEGLEGLMRAAFLALENELEHQVLSDGGHRSRNPADIASLMVELIPLRMALEAARLEIPSRFNAAIERMLPALRFFSHGDGGLAAFNGLRDGMAGWVRTVLETDNVRGKPLTHAVHSGYCRLQAGQAVVIADTGRAPLPGANPQAGLGPLSFEFSDGAHRIVVNCGALAEPDADWDIAARHTAAHSTACLGDEPAGRILAGRISAYVFGGPIVLGPGGIEAHVISNDDGNVLISHHDGYERSFGVTHERRLFLATNGRDLRGEDRFLADLDRLDQLTNVDFAVRFHLHPSLNASLSRDRSSVMLVLPNRQGWRFSARGGIMTLEDSVYMPGQAKPRRGQQIVLRGTVGRPDRVLWAFKRVERNHGPGRKAESAPELPL